MDKNKIIKWDSLALKLYRQFMESVQNEVKVKHLAAVGSSLDVQIEVAEKDFTYEQNFLLNQLAKFNELVYVSLDGETTSTMRFQDLTKLPESAIGHGFQWWPAQFPSMLKTKEWLYAEEPI